MSDDSQLCKNNQKIFPLSEKIGCGVSLRTQILEFLYAVKEYFMREIIRDTSINIDKLLKRTFAILKLGENTITKICNEQNY